jgi:transmembrane sensor
MAELYPDAPWDLLARHLAAEATPGEQVRLREWLRQDARHLQVLATVTRAWERAGEAAPAPVLFTPAQVEAAWQRFRPLMHGAAAGHATASPTSARPRLAVTARRWGELVMRRGVFYALPLVALAYAFVRSGNGAGGPEAVAYAQAYHPRLVQLPDGSRAWLNAHSRLDYAARPAAGPRMVRLTGEAYFEVQPNPARPFLVSSATARVRVVGTAFNVRAYAAEDSVEVSVAHGRVWLARLGGPPDSVLLTAGTRAALRAADAPGSSAVPLSRALAPDANFRAWQTDTLRFRDATVAHVARTLRAAFGTRIELASPGLARCRFTGTFAHPQPAQVLAVLALATGSRTEKVATGGYVLRGPGCGTAPDAIVPQP